MLIALKGLHKVKRRLAGGGESVHYYAWRGGPKIEAPAGTAEFIAEFKELTKGRDAPIAPRNDLQGLIDAYRSTNDFTSLSDSTRKC